MAMHTPILKTTVSTLAFAVSLALGSAALAGEGKVHDTKGYDQDTTTQKMQQQSDRTALQTDAVDAMNPRTIDTAPPVDSTTMDDMDEPAYDATAQTDIDADVDADLDTDLDTDTDGYVDPSAQAGVGVAASGELKAFGEYDANADGYVERSELKGDNSLVNDGFVRFDSNNDGRLDNYEFDTFSNADFAALDANGDGNIDSSESASFQALSSSFMTADSNGDGMISKAEHKTFVDTGAWSSDRDRYAFNYLDRDGDGYVSRTEASVFADLQAEFDTLDVDGDGLVDNTQYDGFLSQWNEDGTVAFEEGDQE